MRDVCDTASSRVWMYAFVIHKGPMLSSHDCLMYKIIILHKTPSTSSTSPTISMTSSPCKDALTQLRLSLRYSTSYQQHNLCFPRFVRPPRILNGALTVTE